MRFAGTMILLAALANLGGALKAQEAERGIDLRTTLTGEAATSNELMEPPRSGNPGMAGFRGVLYPTIKFNDNLWIGGALQLTTRPYYYEQFSSEYEGAKGAVLQASLNYSRVSDKGSLLLQAGQLSTAFGSFLLRYDDGDNPVVDLPLQYGYYYAPVSTMGLTAAEVSGTRGKWDGRVQFANSSPANPRSIFDHDQYGNWSGGAGYTIRQGLRVGLQGYRGPYLDRESPRYFPGELAPSKLPAKSFGMEASWVKGHTSVLGEVQHFTFPYHAIPTFEEWAAYTEMKQVLAPRWYLAERLGTTSSSFKAVRAMETAAGFRPNRFQLIKLDYEAKYQSRGTLKIEHTLTVQIVTTLHKSVTR